MHSATTKMLQVFEAIACKIQRQPSNSCLQESEMLCKTKKATLSNKKNLSECYTEVTIKIGQVHKAFVHRVIQPVQQFLSFTCNAVHALTPACLHLFRWLSPSLASVVLLCVCWRSLFDATSKKSSCLYMHCSTIPALVLACRHIFRCLPTESGTCRTAVLVPPWCSDTSPLPLACTAPLCPCSLVDASSHSRLLALACVALLSLCLLVPLRKMRLEGSAEAYW